MKKTVGIIGGMGPLATADLFTKIIQNTRAASDQEHLHLLIDSDTDIPDRTAALLGGGEDPLPEMARSARRLEAAGAELLAMPCNTAHCFYGQLCRETFLPVLNMVEETVAEIGRAGFSRVVLLGTDGLLTVGPYQAAFERSGIRASQLSVQGQRQIMRLIYQGVKAGDDSLDISPLRKELDALQRGGAEAFVLACTELPIAFERYHIAGRTLDPTLALARAIVREAGGELTPA